MGHGAAPLPAPTSEPTKPGSAVGGKDAAVPSGAGVSGRLRQPLRLGG